MTRQAAAVVMFAALASLTLSARADRVHLDSHLKDGDVVIDGNISEWTGPFVTLDEQHPVAVAITNDGEYLYLALTASDAAVRRQILAQGLIVWFDPEGKETKHYGIKFPVGMLPGERGRAPRPVPGEPGDEDEPARPARPQGFEEPVNRLEILGPKKDNAHSFVADRAPGVTVKLAEVEGSIVYELRVPLAATADVPYAVGARPGATIGLGLETPKVERPSMEGRRGGAGMGGFGGVGGRSGGMGGRGGGMGGRGGRQFEPARPMKIWATVRLAS